MKQELLPKIVPYLASRGGEAVLTGSWGWVEPGTWSQRMLAALEQGVKGGKWYSLMDKVYAESNLRAAFRKVAKNKGSAGVDRVTIGMFGKHLEENLKNLHEQLKTGTYRPQAIRRVYIPKAGSNEKRPLGIPTVRDRVVQTALRNVIEPIFEWEFAEHSYGFRPGRGCKDALREVKKQLHGGNLWVVDADLKRYFDTINHERLMELLEEKVADRKVLGLVEAYLQQQVLDGMALWTPETGTPQGAVASPLLANLYLNPLDHKMADSGMHMVRYADDYVILCRDEHEAHQALQMVKQWCEQTELTLHPSKTRIANLNEAGEGFDFLGYRIQRTKAGKIRQWPRAKSVQKFRMQVRPITRRANGHSMASLISDLNPILRGFFEYFKHSTLRSLNDLDGWVRMRLRSILRKRRGRRGRAQNLQDHRRWPNSFFGELGLFCMSEARAQLCQSPQG
jgi:RNA-directed DNA polymerase